MRKKDLEDKVYVLGSQISALTNVVKKMQEEIDKHRDIDIKRQTSLTDLREITEKMNLFRHNKLERLLYDFFRHLGFECHSVDPHTKFVAKETKTE